tara:strand:- start:193 stop:837 length:645 start_codon:yes stop_codon:yes gene_type:complete
MGMAAVKAFESYHMDALKWDGVAYNWLVDSSGAVFEGRGAGVRGAATKGWNARSESVCYTGWGYDPVPTVALKAIQSVIDDVQFRYGGSLWVRGHRDVSSSTCPGDWLYAWLADGGTIDEGGPSDIDWAGIVAYLTALKDRVTVSPLSRRSRSRGEAVRVAQSRLKNRGYEPGPVDGIYGRRTAAAVTKFEKAMGFLKPNGVLDGATWTALFFV